MSYSLCAVVDEINFLSFFYVDKHRYVSESGSFMFLDVYLQDPSVIHYRIIITTVYLYTMSTLMKKLTGNGTKNFMQETLNWLVSFRELILSN